MRWEEREPYSLAFFFSFSFSMASLFPV